jgi:predicted phosphodiesterase
MSEQQLDWKEAAVRLSNTSVMSRRQIAEYLGVPRSTCLDYLRAYYSALAEDKVSEMYYEAPVKDEHDNSRILFISDMHIPYHHEDLIPFLLMLKDRYKPTRVICLGDELDKHALSFHASDPDLKSAGDELAAALPIIAKIHNIFPKMDLIDSNHGSMVYRKAKEHGIPRRYIRSYNEVLGVGDGWVWHNDLTIELPDGQQVYVHHGKSADAIKTSQAMSMSHVCGHFHESFGVKYWANPNGLFWAMNAGCLIDDKSLAFQYNNVNLKRPIIGTGLIIDGVPVLEAMQL